MKKLNDTEKFNVVKREAFYTALALAALIIFWLIAGFGTSSLEVKIFHIPMWAILGTIGVWFFAIFLSFILSKKIFTDFDLEDEK